MMLKILFLAIFINFANANAQTLKVVTTDFPPYQIVQGENIGGITTEIVNEVINGAGLRYELRSYPWPRAYKIAQNEANVLIYSITRTPEREKLFKWIGTISPFDVYFWKLSERADIKINSLDDAKKYLVGGVNSDIKSAYLLKEGFITGKNLTLLNSDEVNLQMLYAKRIDLLPADKIGMNYRIKHADLEANQFTKVLKLKNIPNELYLAASLATSDEVVIKLQKSLETFQKTKQYRKIQKKLKTSY